MNKFCLTNCRFHVKEKNKLVFLGYFEDGEMEENRPVFTMDYSLLACEVRLVRRCEEPLLNMWWDGEKKQYIFVVTLPDNYREYKELRCFQYEQEHMGEVFHFSVEWIEKLRERKDFSIDDAIFMDGSIHVGGWCFFPEEVEIYLSESKEKGSLRTGKVERTERPDVEKAYPECEKKEIFGFSVTAAYPKREIWCIVEDTKGNRLIEQKLYLKRADIEKHKRQIKMMTQKVKVYHQQFGIHNTVTRAWEKLSGKEETAYQKWSADHTPTPKDLMRQRGKQFSENPTYGIVVPIYRTPKKYLEEMIRSVREQSYGKWTLYLSDGSGENSPVRRLLERYERSDARIRVIYNERELQISENTNQALEMVSEDFVVFMDHDDLLAPDALYECTRLLNMKHDTDMIYTDEDKVSMDGTTFFQPHFKADFNIELMCSANYLCHLLVVRNSFLKTVGYLRSEYDGSQDYDLILRCVEKTDRIEHIPKILYHWRSHMNSTAGNPENKDYAYIAGQRAIEAHYQRCNTDAQVMRLTRGFYRTKYKLTEKPLISVIVPNKDHGEDLERCIRSVIEKSNYHNLEILIAENGSVKEETFQVYDRLKSWYSNIRVIEWNQEFNYSAINNYIVEQANGEYLLLLNNDTEMIEEESLEEMVSFCMREGTGIVGARLFYPDKTVQHAGVIVGMGGVAGHAFSGLPGQEIGYFSRACCQQEYSAVTGACMMVKKSVYEEAGGMDEELEVSFSDVDFCLRVRQLGYKVIYTPFATFYHYESKTRGEDDTEEKKKRTQKEIHRFVNRWKEFLEKGDPFYNPNLTLEKHDFSLKI